MGKIQSKLLIRLKRKPRDETWGIPSHLIHSSQSPNPSSDYSNSSIDDTNYVLPGGDISIHPLVLNHYLAQEVWGTSFSCPCEDIFQKSGTKVLDLGSGPGTWVMEMAIEYPLTHFTGIELDPLYPMDVRPSNTNFVHADILAGLPFPDDTFDYVRSAFMVFAFKKKDWNEVVIPEIIRVTKPGGWIEVMEKENVWINEGPLAQNYRLTVQEFFRSKMDMELLSTPLIEQGLKNSNRITTIDQAQAQIPMGKWGGKIGELDFEIVRFGAEGIREIMAPQLGLTKEAYEELIDEIEKECNKHKVSVGINRLWARKDEV